jgi:thioesterase domain-containing protein
MELEFGQKIEYLRRRAKTAKRKIKSSIWRLNTSLHIENNKLSNIFQNVVESNYLALRKYKILDYQGKITLFRATDGNILDKGNVFLGWNEITKNQVRVYDIPGNHIQMFEEPYIQELAKILNKILSDSENNSELVH